MISQASQLLAQFIAAERKALEGVDMPHMPTLGAAYEAIASQGIDQQYVIPKMLGLRVVSGFIKVGDTQLPNQIDCMLVDGEGEQYGLTDTFIYPIEQILCIVEVKKTLGKADLLDASKHLADVKKAAGNWLEQRFDENKWDGDISATRLHFSQISGFEAPKELADRLRLPWDQAALFHTLLIDHIAPATVALGFDGYKTESGLRRAFVDLIEQEDGSSSSFGAPNLPSLVLASDFSLVKANGLPYIAKYLPRKWTVLASIRGNAARVLLEIIWTKIGHFYGIRMPWNDGLEMENLSPLLSATPMQQGSNYGWAYQTHEPNENALRSRADVEWCPAIINCAAAELFDLMIFRGGCVRVDDAHLDDYFQTHQQRSLENVCEELLHTSYFMLEEGHLRPIHKLTLSVERKDGATCIAYDRTKLDEWCAKHAIDPYYMSLVFVDGED